VIERQFIARRELFFCTCADALNAAQKPPIFESIKVAIHRRPVHFGVMRKQILRGITPLRVPIVPIGQMPEKNFGGWF
jgi:hypothetical protein